MESKEYFSKEKIIKPCNMKKSPELDSEKKNINNEINLKIFAKLNFKETTKAQVVIENTIFKTYVYVHYDNTRLLMARRTLYGFNIYSMQSDNQLIGILKANIFGTRYKLEYPSGDCLYRLEENIEDREKDNLSIKYETSFLHRGKPRSFVVSLDSMELCNKKPYFNNETLSFSLNFNGRVTKPSVRNLQIVHPLDPTYITLTFGKETNDKYILDFSYPWITLKAFCVALSALDHKFGCD